MDGGTSSLNALSFPIDMLKEVYIYLHDKQPFEKKRRKIETRRFWYQKEGGGTVFYHSLILVKCCGIQRYFDDLWPVWDIIPWVFMTGID